ASRTAASADFIARHSGTAAPASLSRPSARTASTRTAGSSMARSEEHTSELQSLTNLVCRLLLEKKYFEAPSDPRWVAIHHTPPYRPVTEKAPQHDVFVDGLCGGVSTGPPHARTVSARLVDVHTI